MKRFHSVLAVVSLLIFMCGCQSSDNKSGKAPTKDTSGIICNVEMVKGVTDDLSEYNVIIEILPETGKITGFAGCNHFFGQCEANIETGQLYIQSLSATKKACRGKSMQLDRLIQFHVPRLTSFEIKDDYVLFYENDVLYFSGKRQ